MTRYHVNPSNKVLRCNAQSADSCPYGSKAHFEGDGDQAKFMQDALDRNLKKAPPAPKAAPRAKDFSFTSLGDNLYAREQEDGTYTIYLTYNGESIEIEGGIASLKDQKAFARHLGDVARTSGYAGTVVDTAWMREDPEVTQVREVRANINGTGEPIGYLIKKGGGWATIRKLSELRSRPAASRGTGVLRAAANLRREVAQQQSSKQALAEAAERGKAAAAKIVEKVDLMENLKRSLQPSNAEEAERRRLVENGEAVSLRSRPTSLTTKPPFPYGPGSGQ